MVKRDRRIDRSKERPRGCTGRGRLDRIWNAGLMLFSLKVVRAYLV